MPFELSESARVWASKPHQRVSPTKLRELLIKQKARCALSKAPLLFDKSQGTPQKGGDGVHPLYPAVDHKECRNAERGHQIVCYALNDVKGHVPFECFEALKRTKAWRQLMKQWRSLAEEGSRDRKAFRRLIFPNEKQAK